MFNNIVRNNFILSFFVFILSFGMFLFTLYPTISPYRDSGDMIVSGYTLGIAHPSAYPLYVLSGKIFDTLIPFSNHGYRLNLFSSFFSALSAVVFFQLILLLVSSIENQKNVILHVRDRILVYIFTIFFVFSSSVWHLSVVSEMYTLNMFFTILLILLVLKTYLSVEKFDGNFIQLFCLIYFLFGISLGNHLTIILLSPGIIFFSFYALKKKSLKIKLSTAINSIFFFLLGISLYIFLPVRSKSNALINWGEPHTLSNFFDVIRRTGYGGLALYEAGEVQRNLGTILEQFFKFFELEFYRLTLFIFLFALIGFYYIYLKSKKIFFGFILFYFFPGPLFYIIANLRFDQYNITILKVYDLIPDLILIIIASLGVIYIIKNIHSKIISILFIIFVIFFVFYSIIKKFQKYNFRESFIAYDYGINSLRTVKKNSIILAKSDTLFFVLRHLNIIDKKRVDVSSMPFWFNNWYLNQVKRKWPYIIFSENENNADVEIAIKNFKNFSVYTNYTLQTSNLPPPIYAGIFFWYVPESLDKNHPLRKETFHQIMNLYYFRNLSSSKINNDYYHQEIIKAYSAGIHNLGLYNESKKDWEQAKKLFLFASYLDPNFIEPLYELGLISYFSDKDYNKTISFAKRIINKKTDHSQGWNLLGSAYGSTGNYELAIKYFQKALQINPEYLEAKQNYQLLNNLLKTKK